MVTRRRIKQRPITSLAKDRPCLIRLPGICNGDPKRTVPCHFRMQGLSGIGYIPDAIFFAFGCDDCHRICDKDKSDAAQLAFAQGVLRTQSALLKSGVIKIQQPRYEGQAHE